jgi:two-component system phosphate regulon sensor histidine kinase PhoR
MSPAVLADLRRVVLLVGAATLLGLIAGSALAGLAVGLLLLSGSQLRELWRMHRWLHSRGARPPRRVGLLGDVEDRLERLQRQARKRKKRLRKVAQRFQQAAEANPDGAVILEENGAIEWLNRGAARMLGLRQGQDHGQFIVNLVRTPSLAEWLEEGVAGEPFELDSPIADGQRLLLRAVPYGAGKRMLIVRDITRLHSLEQMRKDFVANVSHELRSPLTVIVGYLEGMSHDETLPLHLRRPVEQMSAQSARMTRIVEDLLRLSRIESDPGGAARETVAVADMVDAILRDAARLGAAERTVTVESEAGCLLLGDYNELFSAFSNLVFNAVQYTPSGGRVEVRWTCDGDGACFEVQDTGVGIAAHHIPRLTERFYRVDKARSRELGGTGLGLAITKHVLMRHGAVLEVRSDPGEGSTFSCRFPGERVRRVRESEAAGAAPPAAPGSAA